MNKVVDVVVEVDQEKVLLVGCRAYKYYKSVTASRVQGINVAVLQSAFAG